MSFAITATVGYLGACAIIGIIDAINNRSPWTITRDDDEEINGISWVNGPEAEMSIKTWLTWVLLGPIVVPFMGLWELFGAPVKDLSVAVIQDAWNGMIKPFGAWCRETWDNSWFGKEARDKRAKRAKLQREHAEWQAKLEQERAERAAEIAKVEALLEELKAAREDIAKERAKLAKRFGEFTWVQKLIGMDKLITENREQHAEVILRLDALIVQGQQQHAEQLHGMVNINETVKDLNENTVPVMVQRDAAPEMGVDELDIEGMLSDLDEDEATVDGDAVTQEQVDEIFSSTIVPLDEMEPVVLPAVAEPDLGEANARYEARAAFWKKVLVNGDIAGMVDHLFVKSELKKNIQRVLRREYRLQFEKGTNKGNVWMANELIQIAPEDWKIAS